MGGGKEGRSEMMAAAELSGARAKTNKRERGAERLRRLQNKRYNQRVRRPPVARQVAVRARHVVGREP